MPQEPEVVIRDKNGKHFAIPISQIGEAQRRGFVLTAPPAPVNKSIVQAEPETEAMKMLSGGPSSQFNPMVRERALGVASEVLPAGEKFNISTVPRMVKEAVSNPLRVLEGVGEMFSTAGQVMTLGSIDATTGQPIAPITEKLLAGRPEEPAGLSPEELQAYREGRGIGIGLNVAGLVSGAFGGRGVVTSTSTAKASFDATRKAAARRLNNSLFPSQSMRQLGKRSGAQLVEDSAGATMVKENIGGATYEGILKNTESKLAAVQGEHRALLASPQAQVAQINVHQVISDRLDSVIKQVRGANNELANALEQRKADMLAEFPQMANPQQALEINARIRSAVSFAGDANKDTVNNVLRGLTGEIADAVDSAVPGSRGLTRRMEGLINLRDVAAQQAARKEALPIIRKPDAVLLKTGVARAVRPR